MVEDSNPDQQTPPRRRDMIGAERPLDRLGEASLGCAPDNLGKHVSWQLIAQT
jgi:hypothetical protein